MKSTSVFWHTKTERRQEYLDYWSQIYATTQSAALKQKAATILGIKTEKK